MERAYMQGETSTISRLHSEDMKKIKTIQLPINPKPSVLASAAFVGLASGVELEIVTQPPFWHVSDLSQHSLSPQQLPVETVKLLVIVRQQPSLDGTQPSPQHVVPGSQQPPSGQVAGERTVVSRAGRSRAHILQAIIIHQKWVLQQACRRGERRGEKGMLVCQIQSTDMGGQAKKSEEKQPDELRGVKSIPGSKLDVSKCLPGPYLKVLILIGKHAALDAGFRRD
ncbi:hypothetical protein K438DRAFT_1776956 [Mycena galopus ATCC 62051]|nr:hypothetical protein K438DRAFT_1776956 [Mycena galopus ATCC 62051]